MLATYPSRYFGLRNVGVAIGVFLGCLAPNAAAIGELNHEFSEDLLVLDVKWVLICSALVFLMQIGFLLYEAGMLRAKNSINVVFKNLLDTTFGILGFIIAGSVVAFGSFSMVALHTLGPEYAATLERLLAFLTYHALVCCTAITIISGAVAERMKMSAYIIVALAVSIIVYPIFQHLINGNHLFESTFAYLGDRGFFDFAGGVAVHGTGGWFALAFCIVLGPRVGRFNAAGHPVSIYGHNIVVAAAGVLLVWVGWWGFNAGAAHDGKNFLAVTFLNTALGGATGGVVGVMLSMFYLRIIRPVIVFEGVIAGLVSVTAGCAILPLYGAVLLAIAGTLAAVASNYVLLHRLKIDDALGVVGVHGVAGAIGALGLAWLAPIGVLPLDDRIAQFSIQATGVMANILWAFSTGIAIALLLKHTMGIRVREEVELAGLDQVVHGARFRFDELGDAVARYMEASKGKFGDFSFDNEAERTDFSRFIATLSGNLQGRTVDGDKDELNERRSLKSLADVAHESIVITSGGKIIACNESFERMLSLSLGNLQGMLFSSLFDDNEREKIEHALANVESKPTPARITGEEIIPVELHTKAISYRGKPVTITTVIDRSEVAKAKNRIGELRNIDALTGLMSRSKFTEAANEMLSAQGERNGFALYLIDIEKFKDLNDTYGQEYGDMALKIVAERLRKTVRRDDICGRLGGDDLAVCNGTAEPDEEFANRLIAILGQSIPLERDAIYHPKIYIGAAHCSAEANELTTIMKNANTALDEAKSSATERFRVFDQSIHVDRRARKMIAQDLAGAVRRTEFELFLQPKYSAESSSIHAFEALIRWHHPERGLVSPGEFLPIAEDAGLMTEIGCWVIEEAFRLSKEKLKGRGLSLNVAVAHFLNPGFLSFVDNAMKKMDVDPSLVEFEITEDAVLSEFDRADAIIRQLQSMGFSVALDDFGTGYSSLAYLSRYSFNTIKLDRAFIVDLAENSTTKSVVASVIQLCKTLNLTVVAEGIETPEQIAELLRYGCQEFQGFYIARPANVDTFDELAIKRAESVFQVNTGSDPSSGSLVSRG